MDYELSMICFKKILVYAWALDKKDLELEAMQNVGTSLFHMGLVSESRVYSDRAHRGIYEADHSSAKQVAKQQYERHQKTRQVERQNDPGYEFGYENCLNLKIRKNKDTQYITLDFTNDKSQGIFDQL